MLLKNCLGQREPSFEPRVSAHYVGDLQAVDFQVMIPRRVAASATRFEAGEPLNSTSTLTSGLTGGGTGANIWVLATADFPVIGTDRFGGICSTGALPDTTGTLIAQTQLAACPIPWLGRMRGRAETVASVDTDAEILLLIGDVVLIDYSATGAPDSGQLYTLKEVGSADTSGLEIVEGNPATQRLDVLLDGRVYRHDVA